MGHFGSYAATAAPRKRSTSSTHRPNPVSSRSRSSSKHSRRKRITDEQRPRRIHSSPPESLSRNDLDDARAFHERSCRIVESLMAPPRSVTDPVTRAQHPARPQLPHAKTYAYYPTNDFQRAAVPRSMSETSSIVDEEKFRPGDHDNEEVQPVLDHPPEHATDWTSDATRRLQYAAIDRRNRRLPRLLRRLLPDCLVGRRSEAFYDEDMEGSDAGSVRRYRMALPTERKT